MLIGGSGCAALACTGWMLRWQLRALRWQRARALVQEAWLDEVGAVTAGAWKVGVRYRFTAANGREYRGDRPTFESTTHRRRAAAEAQLKPLRPGHPIDVWYDPADPTQSVIDRELHWPRFAAAAVGLLIFIGTVVPLVGAALAE